jgi:hypothetical protein
MFIFFFVQINVSTMVLRVYQHTKIEKKKQKGEKKEYT